MICTNCKKEIDDDSKYCQYCGAIFEDAIAVLQDKSSKKAKKLCNVFVVIIIVLLTFALIIGGLIYWYVNVFSKLSYEKELALELERLESQEFEIETERMDELQTSMIETPPEIIGKWEFIGQDDCYGYEFMADGTMHYLVQFGNGEIEEKTYQYAFLDENTISYGVNNYDNELDIVFNESDNKWCYIDNHTFAEDFSKRDEFGFNAVISEDDPSVVSSFIRGKWKGLYDDTVYGFEFFDDGTMEMYTKAEDEDAQISTYFYEIIDSKSLNIIGGEVMKIEYEGGVPSMEIAWNEIWDEFSVYCERTVYYPTDMDTASQLDKTGLVKNIEVYIDGTSWESTGKLSVIEETINLAGFPLNYFVEQGDTVISFADGVVNIKERYKTYGSDEWEWNKRKESIWMGDPEGYFIYANSMEEELRGKTYLLSDVYYVKNDMLYYFSTLDDVICSNIIEYKKIN